MYFCYLPLRKTWILINQECYLPSSYETGKRGRGRSVSSNSILASICYILPKKHKKTFKDCIISKIYLHSSCPRRMRVVKVTIFTLFPLQCLILAQLYIPIEALILLPFTGSGEIFIWVKYLKAARPTSQGQIPCHKKCTFAVWKL